MTRIELGPFPEDSGYEEARHRDREDPLAPFRDRFLVADEGLIYLDGNSLGPLPLDAAARAAEVVRREWGERLIRSWNEGWWELHNRIGDLIAPLIGAGRAEVVVSDSTSVNLFKLAVAALRARPGRLRVLTDDLNFPGDIYVLEAAARAAGARHRVEVVVSDGISGPVEELEEALDDDVALLSLSHTTFKSGYSYDLARLSAAAHRAGALTLWDLSHSVGAVPLDLTAAGADLAVGCTYKYLNGGPGSPAFLYVRASLQDTLENPISGWWAHRRPFDFDLNFEPDPGVRRFHVGTIPVLSVATIEAGVSLIAEAGMARIRDKSSSLSRYLIDLAEEHLAPLGFGLASPLDPERRGSHLAFTHPQAWGTTRALIEEAAVVPDFRTPDAIRVGLAPLYLRFVDLHTAVHRLRRVVSAGLHLAHAGERPPVT